MRRFLIPGLVAVSALALSGPAAALRVGPGGLPPGWSHAEVNVIIKRHPHTLIYDRGRIVAVTATSLTLRERDGSVWTIDVAPTTAITISGQPAQLSQVRPLENATTLRIDGGPATRVAVQIPPRVAARLGISG